MNYSILLSNNNNLGFAENIEKMEERLLGAIEEQAKDQKKAMEDQKKAMEDRLEKQQKTLETIQSTCDTEASNISRSVHAEATYLFLNCIRWFNFG